MIVKLHFSSLHTTFADCDLGLANVQLVEHMFEKLPPVVKRSWNLSVNGILPLFCPVM